MLSLSSLGSCLTVIACKSTTQKTQSFVLSLFNFPIHVKKLSDLNLEIWNMNQVEDEDEPFEMAFDKEEG